MANQKTIQKQNVEIWYRIRPFRQPTETSCWSAAATMILGTNRSIGPGTAQLSRTGELAGGAQNIYAFARSHGLKVYHPQTWRPQGLAELMIHGPLIVLGRVPDGHAVVVGGIATDGSPDTTRLTIYDPWPKQGFRSKGSPRGKSQIHHLTLSQLYRTYPESTIYVLQALANPLPRHSRVIPTPSK
jgi:hypothetical protein